MRTVFTQVALVISVAFGFLPGPGEPAFLSVDECLEDMPCWDCASMGNLICGKEQ